MSGRTTFLALRLLSAIELFSVIHLQFDFVVRVWGDDCNDDGDYGDDGDDGDDDGGGVCAATYQAFHSHSARKISFADSIWGWTLP